MKKDSDKSTRAFQELVRILGEAVQIGATRIGIEYEDRDLVVYFYSGNTGIGAPRIAEGLEQAVINEIYKRAGLARKPKGKFPVTLSGNDYEVTVEEYMSFDESAFNLTVMKRKKKPGE